MTSVKDWLDKLLRRDRGTGEDAAATMGERPEATTPGVGDVEGGMSSTDDDMPEREPPAPPASSG